MSLTQAFPNGQDTHPVIARCERIIRRLEQLPDEIEEAEQQVLAAEQFRTNAQCLLEQREAYLLLGTDEQETVKIDSKNAEQRQAQLLLATLEERNDVLAATRALDEAKIHLRHLQNEFSAVKALVRWLTPEDER